MKSIRVVQVGLGPIGQSCVQALVQKPGFELVGGVDIDPNKVGQDLGTVCGLDRPLDSSVRSDLAAALSDWRPHVALHTTSSFLDRVRDQLADILSAGVSIVSSTEELFYPFERDAAFCAEIDDLAKRNGVALVGTGVNPGFAMDVLPLCLTSVCVQVEQIRVTRVVDAGKRRLPLQKKVGAGLSYEAFCQRLAAGQFGHIGMRESALAVMAALGWPVDEMEEHIEPVLASAKVQTDWLTVEPQQVAGLHQELHVQSRGQERLALDLHMYVGAQEPHDSVDILGDPPLSMRIEGGIFGDTATVGALVNAIPRIVNAPPGLWSLTELPLPHAFLGMA
jgi:4-hydroxy-tetrahydrodipicolinate reductase